MPLHFSFRSDRKDFSRISRFRPRIRFYASFCVAPSPLSAAVDRFSGLAGLSNQHRGVTFLLRSFTVSPVADDL
ncbi:MAG TPA: hypothetical protein VFE33_29730 [Thermoanaerobaculia bacterium]|nr:hypothetical protein [Thermoanaerobaculia bacterium]